MSNKGILKHTLMDVGAHEHEEGPCNASSLIVFIERGDSASKIAFVMRIFDAESPRSMKTMRDDTLQGPSSCS